MKSRRAILCVANWKANLTADKEIGLARQIAKTLSTKKPKTSVILAPSFLSLGEVKSVIKSHLSLAAQDCYQGQQGAATGEISATALSKIGCRYAIIGHSERRAMGESEVMIHDKVQTILSSQKTLKITPILCIGETASQRDQGKTKHILKTQLMSAFAGISFSSTSSIVIAYEPVWAISSSTGPKRQCTPQESRQAQEYIKQTIADLYPTLNALRIHVIYGGSVDATNAASYVTDGGMDGVLVGSASLQSKSFCAIVHALDTTL